MNTPLDNTPLGKSVKYEFSYNPELLEGVPRSLNREPIGLYPENLPFSGVDVWNLYELSWLTPSGKPAIAVGEAFVDATTTNIIESKSFKLYLNSFNQTHFDNIETVQATLIKDLSLIANGEVKVNLWHQHNATIGNLPGECIDEEDITTECYEIDSTLLTGAADPQQPVEETLHSHLLKSNCLVTGQPDWGSVMVKYAGAKINRAALLKYIISFRQHNEFHEQCVERIFTDIQHYCQPEKLTVYARYTRRGGLDINPFRSNFESAPSANERMLRQ
ncbi:NADPH-dependent 7-cyano-7-deazaguanine reductase QueF [Endozoicomonas sp. SM1973]|uniref:NADPH-dependent 7-cyano-7-deazaguanine reductase n=1 Tax=Spartinivicinus marinus TaxID=2994442 RepID=A0A853HX33_9GAMM|nr:NADPH-dependent 7-cyano-7-deazaguanine reductase QueF [Spartinivicinus marinus]MCX4029364.1 NADPH-dependent 7-cyano-7-deazaguanine reductase QueF [Spartinivicinus marinus]NYZ64939.1 NADPH-dependent 7-cyano-7-deazaguanine reductase QueF [Spartinivicinus marinus]